MFYKIPHHHWEFPHKTAIKQLEKFLFFIPSPYFLPTGLFACAVLSSLKGVSGRTRMMGARGPNLSNKSSCGDEKQRQFPEDR